MTQQAKPLTKDWAFWGSIVRAIIQGLATAAVTTVRYWDPQNKRLVLLIAAVALLGSLVLYDPIRERIQAKKADITAHQLQMVGAALARLVSNVQLASRADVAAITAHVHLVKRRSWMKPRELKLHRLSRLVFNDSFGPTDIDFGPAKGVIGVCLATKAPASVRMTNRTVSVTAESEWNAVPDQERTGLTWSDQRQLHNRKYGGVIAEPVRNDKGQVIAIVSLGIRKGFEANLSTAPVEKAMGTAATDVGRALQFK